MARHNTSIHCVIGSRQTAVISLKGQPMKPGDVAPMPSANRSTNKKNTTAPNFKAVAIDLWIIAKKMAVGQSL